MDLKRGTHVQYKILPIVPATWYDGVILEAFDEMFGHYKVKDLNSGKVYILKESMIRPKDTETVH